MHLLKGILEKTVLKACQADLAVTLSCYEELGLKSEGILVIISLMMTLLCLGSFQFQ